MSKNPFYFERAIHKKGWFKSHQYLLLRRFVQISILLLFSFPLLKSSADLDSDLWGLQGTLANSQLLNTIPLSDPFIFLQSLLSGHIYAISGIVGVVTIVIFYMLLGGKTYCSYICPVNIVTDLSAWIRRAFGIQNQLSLSKKTRTLVLFVSLALSFTLEIIIWELVNPITGLFRAIVFGSFSLANIGLILVLMIFIVDIIGTSHFWCGHICPVGAFYGFLGKKTPLMINAHQLNRCDQCMDCYKVCPEPHVLKKMLKNCHELNQRQIKPSIDYSDCTRCGRCIDVCHENVLKYQFNHKATKINQLNNLK